MRKIYFGISLICSLMAFQLSHAGIYWLPDYLKDNVDTNHRTETDKGGGDLPIECKNYSPSCSNPKILGGKTVRIGNIFCAIECICPSSYSTTKCGGEYTLRGSPCTYNGINYYQGCDPRPCSSGGYSDSSSQTGKICSAVTYGGRRCYSCTDDPCYNLTDHSNDANCKNYGCQTKYAACTSKCQSCYSDNCHNRTAVPTPYGCQTAFADCSSKCQTAYPDNCHNRTDNKTDYGCDKYWADCASKCETGKTCTTTDCSAYKLTSIPANANYTSCTPGCGNSTTTYKLVSCKTDYTDDGKGGCRAKTCAEKDANTKPCGSTCIATTACCGGCATGQTCQNGSCVSSCTPPSAADGWVLAGNTPPDPSVTITPTGATGTGMNSCWIGGWFATEQLNKCDKTWERKYLYLESSDGWFAEDPSKRCYNSDGNEYDKQYQSDGRGRNYECCGASSSNGSSDCKPTPADISSINFYGSFAGWRANRYTNCTTHTPSVGYSVSAYDCEGNIYYGCIKYKSYGAGTMYFPCASFVNAGGRVSSKQTANCRQSCLDRGDEQVWNPSANNYGGKGYICDGETINWENVNTN